MQHATPEAYRAEAREHRQTAAVTYPAAMTICQEAAKAAQVPSTALQAVYGIAAEQADLLIDTIHANH
jgi:hypothetical protein